MNFRCRLGWHRWRYVGERREKPNPWTTEGWNHECERCGQTGHFSTRLDRGPEGVERG